MFSTLQFSPDSSRVLYRADQDTDNVTEIYSVASGGGTPTKLNGPLVANGNVLFDSSSAPTVAGSSTRADQDTNGVIEIYSVASGGGTPTKLNGPLVAGGNVLSQTVQPRQ